MRGQSRCVVWRCSDDKAVTHAATFSLINEDGAPAVSRSTQSMPDRTPAFVFTLIPFATYKL